MVTEIIDTKRLRMIACSPESARAAYQDALHFSKLLKADIPKEWPPLILADVQEWIAKTVAKDPERAVWWVWYFVLKGDSESQDVLIGNAGFKGPPNEEGVAEVGYSILDAYQNRGYATEAVSALIDWAFQDERVLHVVAETFPNLKPSIRIMEKTGMKFLGSGSEEGVIRYSRTR